MLRSNKRIGRAAIFKGEKYFSDKHKLYGFKVEVSVLPTGFAAGCSKHFAGWVSDIDIMVHMKTFHDTALAKTEEKKDVSDTGILSDRYQDSWASLADKGYQGAVEFVRAIYPRKKPPSRLLVLFLPVARDNLLFSIN